MINPSFISVAGSDILISDIKVSGGNGWGDVSMQSMNPDGTWADTTYYYLTLDGMGVEDGWYRDAMGVEAIDNTDVLEFGHGMSLTSTDNDLSITYSGAVKNGNPVVSWDAGVGFLGNPTPVVQYFSDITVSGGNGWGDVSCQKMNPDGSWADTTYYYLTIDGMGVEDGWYRDSMGIDPVDETDYLSPGEATCLTSTDNDLTITFKKVLD